jgi:predicted ribosome quality control (RQC) complex YloA/Tae2 family protein
MRIKQMDLLEKYSSNLPVRRESGLEPSEPSERFEDRSVRGRSPDEVIGERQTETPSQTVPEEEDVSIPAAGKTTITVDGRTYNLNKQQEKQLAEFGVRAFQQQLAQQQAAAQAQAAPPVITNEAIAKIYDPPALQIIDDLVSKNLMEEDLSEVYPRTLKTMVGQMRFAFDKIFENEFKQNQEIQRLNTVIQRLEATIAWLNEHRVAVEGQQETPRRQGKQFVTGGKSTALLNKMVANSGRIR